MLHKYLHIFVVLFTLVANCSSLKAQGDRRAAIQYYWGCQYLINDPVPMKREEIEQSGKCQTAIDHVINFNKELPSNMAFCPPLLSATQSEAARIIVLYMRNNTPRLAERFDMMAYSALRQAWPCS